MAYETKDGFGSLFKNQRKDSEKHPDYTGNVRVAGVLYRLAGWKQTSKDGQHTYLNLKVTPDEERTAAPPPADDDDQIPF